MLIDWILLPIAAAIVVEVLVFGGHTADTAPIEAPPALVHPDERHVTLI